MSSIGENETSNLSMKVPKISKGISKEGFATWSTLFASFALVKGFGTAVTGSDIPNLPTKHPLVEAIPAGVADVKAVKKAVQINDLCVAYLKLASADSNQALKCFKKSCDADYPNGRATEYYANLKKKFGPKMGYGGMNLKSLLAKVKWSKKEGGSVKFFEDIAAIQLLQQQIKSDVLSESDYVLHLIQVLPDKYKTYLQPLLMKDDVTMDELEEAVDDYDDLFNKGDVELESDDDSDNEDEAALAGAETKKGKSGIKCYECHEYGHYARNCPNRKQKAGAKAKFNGQCHNCGKNGHKAADCWEKEENASKRPKNWKKKETALAGTELMLVSVLGSGCPYCIRAGPGGCYGCRYGPYQSDDEATEPDYDFSDSDGDDSVMEPSFRKIGFADSTDDDDDEDEEMHEKDEELDSEPLRDEVEDLENDLDKVLDNLDDDEDTVASGEKAAKYPFDEKLLVPPSSLNEEDAKKFGKDMLLFAEKMAYMKAERKRKYQQAIDDEITKFSKWMKKEESIDTQVTELLENELKKDLYKEEESEDDEKWVDGSSIFSESSSESEEEFTPSDFEDESREMSDVDVDDYGSSMGSDVDYDWESSDDEPDSMSLTKSDIEFLDNEYSIKDEMALAAAAKKFGPEDKYLFIADTAATADVTRHYEDVEPSEENLEGKQIRDNGGKDLAPSVIGGYSFTQCDRNGKEVQQGTLKKIWGGKRFEYNLISIPKRLQDGWILSGDKNHIKLTKGDQVFKFDIVLKVGTSRLFATILKPRKSPEIAAAGLKKSKTVFPISMTEAHLRFGHLGENDVRKTAAACGYVLKRGSAKPCESCAIAKAKQKSVSFESDGEKAKNINERVYLDLMSFKKPKDVKVTVANKVVRMVVDEFSRMGFVDFHTTKNGMIEPLCALFHKWMVEGHPVKYVRMDNAKENFKFIKVANSKEWKLALTEEATGAKTPQRNPLVELLLATCAGRMRAILHNAESDDDQRVLLANEIFRTAVMLDWLKVIEVAGKTATKYEHRFGKLPSFAKFLRTIGEAGVVKTRTQATAKVQDRGTTMMLVGYNINSGGDVYRMWNPATKRITNSRDVTWLNVYFNNRNRKVSALLPSVGENNEIDTDVEDNDTESDSDEDSDEDSDDSDADSDDESETTDDNNDANDDDGGEDAESRGEQVDHDARIAKETTFEPTTTTRSGRTVKRATMFGDVAAAASEAFDGNPMNLNNDELNWLTAATMLSCADTAEEEYAAKLEIKKLEYSLVGAGIGGGFQSTAELKPMKYKQAMATDDKEEWIKAVEKEHENMKKYNVWTPINLADVPKGAKILTSTWAMKKKANGTFRARCNARGYEEIDGIHYDGASIAAPVTNELTVRILIVLMLMAGWIGHVLDVKGAFLRGEFEPGLPKMFMRVPEGFEKFYPPNCVLWLLKTIYGLKEAAMAFWKEMLKAFKHMDFERSKADSCLYFKWNNEGYLTAWLSWVDDCVCFGREKDVKVSVADMNSLFECEDVGNFDEYVGCKIDREGRALRMTQPVLIQSFEDEFDLNDVRSADVPATAGNVLVPVDEEAEGVEKSLLTKFRSGVGKLLHLMRWSRPDVCNAVRDLSRHGQKCCDAHMKALKKCMKYCVETKELGWFLKPLRSWDGKDKSFKFVISGKSDSDYACCPTTRRSVSGTCVFLEGAPISVKSSMQKIVALSVTEAETIAAVQCAQEMILAYKIITSMGLQVQLPMILEVDNKGAVDLANSWTHGGRTKHMQVRNFWLRELKEKNLLRVEWIAGADNAADLFTKNLAASDFKKHRDAFVS